ncbi:MAG: choice-of-anchor O protein [Pseudomonadales bacterium]
MPRYVRSFALALASLLAQHSLAYTELEFPDTPVDLTPAPASTADKARLLALSDGTLVAAWHEGAGPAGGAWDLDGNPFRPRDVFVRFSSDDGETWSAPLNVSNTAGQTDPAAFYDRIGDGSGLANYYGDSGKASIFSVGTQLLVTWDDTWCGPGVHGPALYEGTAGFVEIPFHCLYAARIDLAGGALGSVIVDQITTAARDVTNEVPRGTNAGFALAWQEDPQGLQRGEALGEGDGASGARVSPGTDIWYAWLPAAAFSNPAATWQAPVPVTNNYDYTLDTALGGGASRPTLALAGSPPRALLIYEEAKGGGAADPGKYAIYNEFPAAGATPFQAGVIVSDPTENARRARVVAQGTPGSDAGTRLLLMWRQGDGIQGAPADFMMRVGRVPSGVSVGTVPEAGFRAEDLWPPVDLADPTASSPALNLSGAQLDDPTGVDPNTDAKAHRAVLDGDFIFAGYTQNPDVTAPESAYSYLVRSSSDSGVSWTAPADVSTPGSGTTDVIEPRLLRTPGSTPSGDPRDVRDPNTYVFAWGTQVVPAGATEPVPEALYVTRSRDQGATFEPVRRLTDSVAGTAEADEGVQLRVTADGEQVSAVWIRADGADSNALFSRGVGVTRIADLALSADIANATPAVDETASVSFRLSNGGPDIATETQLQLLIDAGLQLLQVTTSAGACSLGAQVTCLLGDLANGASADVQIDVVAAAAGSYPISASASALEEEPSPENNAAALTLQAIPYADLSVWMGADATQIKRGEEVVVRYTVRNDGPQPASAADLLLAVPATLTIIDGGSCIAAAAGLSCTLGPIGPGGSASGSLTLRADVSGTQLVAATVTGTEADPVPGNNSFTLGLRVRTPGGGGGCSVQPGGPVDPSLPLILAAALAHRLRRLRAQQAIATPG